VSVLKVCRLLQVVRFTSVWGAAIGVCMYSMIAIGVREESDDATRSQIIYSTRLHL